LQHSKYDQMSAGWVGVLITTVVTAMTALGGYSAQLYSVLSDEKKKMISDLLRVWGDVAPKNDDKISSVLLLLKQQQELMEEKCKRALQKIEEKTQERKELVEDLITFAPKLTQKKQGFFAITHGPQKQLLCQPVLPEEIIHHIISFINPLEELNSSLN